MLLPGRPFKSTTTEERREFCPQELIFWLDDWNLPKAESGSNSRIKRLPRMMLQRTTDNETKATDFMLIALLMNGFDFVWYTVDKFTHLNRANWLDCNINSISVPSFVWCSLLLFVGLLLWWKCQLFFRISPVVNFRVLLQCVQFQSDAGFVFYADDGEKILPACTGLTAERHSMICSICFSYVLKVKDANGITAHNLHSNVVWHLFIPQQFLMSFWHVSICQTNGNCCTLQFKPLITEFRISS